LSRLAASCVACEGALEARSCPNHVNPRDHLFNLSFDSWNHRLSRRAVFGLSLLWKVRFGCLLFPVQEPLRVAGVTSSSHRLPTSCPSPLLLSLLFIVWRRNCAARPSKRAVRARQRCPMPVSARRHLPISLCSRHKSLRRARASPALGQKSSMSFGRSSKTLKMKPPQQRLHVHAEAAYPCTVCTR
jgi:hypothetical protein